MCARRCAKLIAEGRTNRQVGQYLNLSPKTIEKYRASVMHKLAIENVTELVLAAISMGLLTSLASKCAEPETDDGLYRLPVAGAQVDSPAGEAENAALPRMSGTTAA